jgi:solute carrier family 25 S-adenosylmethionine transporter 26
VRRVASGGLRGFYLGSGATVSRELLFAVVHMPVFEELKRSHPWRVDDSAAGQGLVGAACGGLAGGLAGAVTTPLDVAKTQIMLSPKDARRQGVLQTMAALHGRGGVKALFRGAGPRVAHVGASCALSFGVFQCVRTLVDRVSW